MVVKYSGPKDGGRMRCIWRVSAGVVPGTAVEEYAKMWVVDSDTYYKELEMTDEQFKAAFPDGRGTFAQYRDEAYEYAKSINNPKYVNWVDVSWLYY